MSALPSRVIHVAVPDLISNSYFPAVAAVEMGFFKAEGLEADLQLLFSEFDGLFDPPLSEVRTLTVTSKAPIVWEPEADETRDGETNGVAIEQG